MDRDAYEQMKAAEKAHLRKLKEIKRRGREAVRMAKVKQALHNMKTEETELGDTHEDMLRKLSEETIESEVRLEMAMENSGVPAETAQPSPEDAEALRKAKAAELVRQFKSELAPSRADTESAPPDETKASADSPPKTIGRVPVQDAAEDDEESSPTKPDKTIGRM